MDSFQVDSLKGKRISLVSFGFKTPKNTQMRKIAKPFSKHTRIVDVRKVIPNTCTNWKTKDGRNIRKIDNFYQIALALIVDSVNDSPIDLEYAFGCSRGKSRSVIFVDRMRKDLEKLGITVSVWHRDA